MRSLRTAWLAAIASCGLSGAALAADLPVKAPVYKAQPPVVAGWTGFYVGINGGYGWGDSRVTLVPTDPASGILVRGEPLFDFPAPSIGKSGWAGGVQAGYARQIGPRWVAGIEADFDLSHISGDVTAPVPVGGNPGVAVLQASQTIKWFGTLRARLGFLANPNLLLYATGGLAYGQIDESARVAIAQQEAVIEIIDSSFGFICFAPGAETCFAGSRTRTSVGWTAGAGAQYKMTNRVSLKLEYLHVDLGSDTFNLVGTLPPEAPGIIPSKINASFDAAFDIVRGGVNWHF